MRAWVGGVLLGAFVLCTVIGVAESAFADGCTLPQGCLGTTTVPQFYVLIGGPSTLRVTAVATSSLGLVGSVSNVDGTLTVSPTTGAVIASINLAHANIWTALQTFSNASTSLFTVSGTQWITPLATGAGAFLAVDTNGKIIATTSPTTGGGIVGPGTTGQNAYYSALNTVTGTSSLFTATSGFIGIGTTTPAERLVVNSNTTGLPAGAAGTILHVGGADATNPRIFLDAFGGIPVVNFRRADGTAASPTAVQNDEIILNFAGLGYGSTGYSATARTAFTGNAAENWTDTNQGTYMAFFTTPKTTTTNTERMRITDAGNVGIGTTTPNVSLVSYNSTNGSGNATFIGDGVNAGFSLERYQTGGQTANFTFKHARGSYASPTTLVTGDNVAAQTTQGYDGTAFRSIASILTGAQTVTGTDDISGFMTFSTRPTGAASANTERMRIDQSGNVGIGTTTPGSLLSVGNTAGINFTTATSTFATGSGINLTGGCFAISGTCLVTGTGALGAGTTGQVAYYNGTNTVVGTSTIFITNQGFIGIGTTTPADTFNSVTAGANTSYFDAYGGQPTMQGRRANGTITSPTAIVTDNVLFSFGGRGFDGTQLTSSAKGQVNVVAEDNWSTSDQGTYVNFTTTASGGTTRSEKMRITGAGSVGIGTTTPDTKLTVSANTSGGQTAPSGTMFHLLGADATTAFLDVDGFAGAPTFVGRRAAGTAASPTAVQANQGLMLLGGRGYGATAYSLDRARISFLAAENWTDTAQGAYIPFQTTPVGGTATVEVMRLTDGGNLGIGTSTVPSRLTVNGDIGTDGTNVTVTGCGTSPTVTVGSTDTAGEVTQGSISTGCTISFSSTKAAAPFCVVTSEAGLGFTFTESTTAITVVNVGALSSTKLTWHCVQNNR